MKPRFGIGAMLRAVVCSKSAFVDVCKNNSRANTAGEIGLIRYEDGMHWPQIVRKFNICGLNILPTLKEIYKE